MPKAKKLPSGNWRTLVFDYTDINKKRHYKSFTASTKSEAEYLASSYKTKQKAVLAGDMTLSEACDRYIASHDGILSPSTIQGYKRIKNNHFEDIMPLKLSKLNEQILLQSVNNECKRPNPRYSDGRTLDPKTIHNSFGFIKSVLKETRPDLNMALIRLPDKIKKIREPLRPEVIMKAVKGTSIELPVLLAMWLSFTVSEIRGITKSRSIKDGYITINQVVVDIDGKPVWKDAAKEYTRIRRHRIPPYIQELIDQVETDQLVTISGHALFARWKSTLEKNGLPHMTFHDLRHVNASVMLALGVPDKYAMERGGWATDNILKSVYQNTFSLERQNYDELIDGYFDKIVTDAN